MPEILLSNQLLASNEIELECRADYNELHGSNDSLFAHRPYMTSQDPSFQEKAIYATLNRSPTESLKNLTEMSLSFGADNTQAIAELMVNLKEYEIALTGAGSSVYSSRIGEFGAAVQRYQEALLEYRNVAYPNAPKSLRAPLERKIRYTFNKMQRYFRHELAKISAKFPKSQKGHPLTHPERAINIARSSRKATNLNVVTQTQAHSLVKFGKYGRYLGNGLAVVDFTNRVGNVHSSYKSGGNWERDLFIESSRFAASSTAGALTGYAGGAALSFIMVATPLGWAGLIIGGIVAASAIAGASIVADQIVESHGGEIYDRIMQSLGVL